MVAQQIADQTAPEDTVWSFQIPGDTFADPDGAILTLTAMLADGKPLPPWLTFDPSTLTFSGTPPENFNGAFDIKVTTDAGALTVQVPFKIAFAKIAGTWKISDLEVVQSQG